LVYLIVKISKKIEINFGFFFLEFVVVSRHAQINNNQNRRLFLDSYVYLSKYTRSKSERSLTNKEEAFQVR